MFAGSDPQYLAFCRTGFESTALPGLQFISSPWVMKFKGEVTPISRATTVVLPKLCVQLSVTVCLAARIISR